MVKDLDVTKLKNDKENLEAQLTQTKKELDRFRHEADKYNVKFNALSIDFSEMSQKLTTSKRLQNTAETEVSGLRKEIEDLSSALFSQANEMVSTARKSENDYKVKNKQLQNEIEEKDMMIQTYQEQLNLLKDILEQMQDESIKPVQKSATNNSLQHPDTTETTDTTDEEPPPAALASRMNTGNVSFEDFYSNILYTPPIQAIRYDLDLFQHFASYGKLQNAGSTEDLAGSGTSEHVDLKESRFYKRILHDDIQPTLRLDTAPGVSFLQKRSLMSAIFNGRVIIEPISSVNESFKRSSLMASSDSLSQPIATPDACAICGESRNDSLEHARLYMLKIYSSKSQKAKSKASANSSTTSLNESSESVNSVTANSTNEYIYTFPLCDFCVLRIRSTCELYAFLRSIKSGVWKFNNEISEKKAWVECTRIRLKMFWSRLGIWDNDPKIVDNKIFNSSQIFGDSLTTNGYSNSSFEFKQNKESNHRHSYAGNFGTYIEKFASGAAVQSETIKEDESKNLEKENEELQVESNQGEDLDKEIEKNQSEELARIETLELKEASENSTT